MLSPRAVLDRLRAAQVGSADQMRWRSYLTVGAWSLFFALAQFRLIVMLFQADYAASVDAARGVVIGRPHWRVYQSRVLGPYLIEALSRLLPGYLAAYAVFSIAMLTVAGVLAWRLGLRLGDGEISFAMLAFFVFQAAFAFLLSRPFLYAWDYIGVVVYLFFLDFVLARKDWRWFVGLFAVAIFNRETAQFIALWMIIDPVAVWALARAGRAVAASLDWMMVTGGAVCAAAGFVIVEALRRVLLVQEVAPQMFHNAPRGAMVHFTLWKNLRMIRLVLTGLDSRVSFVVVLFLVLFVAILARLAYLCPSRLLGLALTYMAMLAALLMSGLVFETRIYVELIPVLVAGSVILASPRTVDRRLGVHDQGSCAPRM